MVLDGEGVGCQLSLSYIKNAKFKAAEPRWLYFILDSNYLDILLMLKCLQRANLIYEAEDTT